MVNFESRGLEFIILSRHKRFRKYKNIETNLVHFSDFNTFKTILYCTVHFSIPLVVSISIHSHETSRNITVPSFIKLNKL